MSVVHNKFLALPPNDNNVYVIQNGSFVPVALVRNPDEWIPTIDDVNTIYLAIDEAMTPLQLTGLNSEVNS